MAMDWKATYGTAGRGFGPMGRRRWRGDADAWLANLGLERRNKAADVFGALGLLAVGAGIGFAVAAFTLPEGGARWRGRIGERFGLRGGGFEPQAGSTGEAEH